jgi:hypothetical protein
MRVLYAAALMALLAGPVYAQGQNPGPPPAAPKSRQEIEADRAAERAYQSSLGNIPDKPAADPWGNARSIDAPKTNATTSATTAAKTAKRINTASPAN